MYESIQKKREKYIKKHKEIVFDVLKNNHIESIVLTFQGGGDDGQFYIDSVNADDKDKAELFLEEPIPQYEIENIKFVCPTVENAIMDLCNEILYFKDIDYSNGDGNNGDIVFDVKERKIAITYEIKESRTDYL
jgi:hypothetical protein